MFFFFFFFFFFLIPRRMLQMYYMHCELQRFDVANIYFLFSNFSQKTVFDISCKLSILDNLHEISKPVYWEK